MPAVGAWLWRRAAPRKQRVVVAGAQLGGRVVRCAAVHPPEVGHEPWQWRRVTSHLGRKPTFSLLFAQLQSCILKDLWDLEEVTLTRGVCLIQGPSCFSRLKEAVMDKDQ